MNIKQLKQALEKIPDKYEVLIGSKWEWNEVNFVVGYHLSSSVILQHYHDRECDKGLDMTKNERQESFRRIWHKAAKWYSIDEF